MRASAGATATIQRLETVSIIAMAWRIWHMRIFPPRCGRGCDRASTILRQAEPNARARSMPHSSATRWHRDGARVRTRAWHSWRASRARHVPPLSALPGSRARRHIPAKPRPELAGARANATEVFAVSPTSQRGLFVQELSGGLRREQLSRQHFVGQRVEAAILAGPDALADEIGGGTRNQIARPSSPTFPAIDLGAGRGRGGDGLGQGGDALAGGGGGLQHGCLGARSRAQGSGPG